MDRSTIAKRDRWERTLNDRKWDRLKKLYQRSSKEIVCNNRLTIMKGTSCKRSLNDLKTRSLKMIAQRS